MPLDPSTYSSSGQQTPAAQAASITPADVDLAAYTRALYIGTAGDLKVKMAGGDVVTFIGVLAGSVLPLRVSQVMAATTAANIIALW